MPEKTNAKALEKRVDALIESDAYRIASEDSEFLQQDDQRSVRLQLEYLKPEQAMQRENIRSTVVVFGSARVKSAEELKTEQASVRKQLKANPESEFLIAKLAGLTRQTKYAKYYDAAREFGAYVSQRFQEHGRRDFVVVTGGGPGIMEAANRGADDVGGRSVGLNIHLPDEQNPNPYVSRELCFQFRYFGMRKLHFMMRAKALVAFPGGFGTLDEVFEVLTLVQTGKIQRIPIVLMGTDYWSRVVDFQFLAQDGFIAAEDVELFKIAETYGEAIEAISKFYDGNPPA